MAVQIVTAFVNGMVCMLFWMFGFFLLKKKKDRLKKILGIILIVWGLILSKDIGYFFINPVENRYLYRLLLILDNCMVAACGIFVLELLRPGNATIGKLLAHVSGFAILTLLYGITGQEIFFQFNEGFTYLYCLVIFVWLVINTIRYNKMVKSLYSDLTLVDISWLWATVVLLLAVLFTWQSLYIRLDFMLDGIYYLLLALVWSVIFFKTNKMIVPEKEDAESVETSNNNELRDERKYESLNMKLKELEENGYFISSPQLTLKELANKIGTNRTYLSDFLNTEKKQSFYDYVNGIRLKHAEELLRNGDRKLMLEEIALKSGFNSLSTFRRAFQKHYGISPAKYRTEPNNPSLK